MRIIRCYGVVDLRKKSCSGLRLLRESAKPSKATLKKSRQAEREGYSYVSQRKSKKVLELR